jgi:hypothetical protein
VWSRSTTRDHAVRATRAYPNTTHEPNSSVRIVTDPAATAQWMEIFHAVVITAIAATDPSMHAR